MFVCVGVGVHACVRVCVCVCVWHVFVCACGVCVYAYVCVVVAFITLHSKGWFTSLEGARKKISFTRMDLSTERSFCPCYYRY